jgi:hypothetical protein
LPKKFNKYHGEKVLKITNETRTIFCIGLNKTGTTSLHQSFSDCGLRSLHDKRWIDMACESKLPNYEAFSDGLTYMLDLENLKLLRPNHKFVLNTRCLYDWLLSRCKHRRAWQPVRQTEMYTVKELVEMVKTRKDWHLKAMSVNPMVFDINNRDDHEKLSDFISVKIKIPHINKRDMGSLDLDFLRRCIEEALEIAEVPQSEWYSVF